MPDSSRLTKGMLIPYALPECEGLPEPEAKQLPAGLHRHTGRDPRYATLAKAVPVRYDEAIETPRSSSPSPSILRTTVCAGDEHARPRTVCARRCRPISACPDVVA